MIHIRDGCSKGGKILAVLDGNSVWEGDTVGGHLLVSISGRDIREGAGTNGEILACMDGQFIREGPKDKGEIIAVIEGDYIRFTGIGEQAVFIVEGFGSSLEKAALTTAVLMLKGYI